MIRTYINTFQIGLVAGMRTFTAPALVNYKLTNTRPDRLAGSRLAVMSSPKASILLTVLAAGELVGDKVPSAPNRIDIQPLSARMVSGAVCGASLSEAEGKQATLGAVAGSVGALVGSYTFFYLRRWLTVEKGLPDFVVALAEDALAIGIGLAATDVAQDYAQ
ncbi:DUF4126 family protein [Spirosoma soli]|uniref:DUF4126 family protein n=1 Tax=Spirosoma soli TaxID=1770529 RepID=A0ABW5M1M5_9BACT